MESKKELKKPITDCPICFCPLDDTAIQIENCEHKFCKECLQEHAKVNITDRKIPIPCPSANCKSTISFTTILDIVEDKALIEKYDNFALMNIFELNPDKLSWCPSAGCNYGFEYDKSITLFKCPMCSKTYCLKCRCEEHKGMTCEAYREKHQDKEFYDLAKQVNMKQCPKCQFWIEKNDGCNHMTCRCRYEFCYVCGKEGAVSHPHTELIRPIINNRENVNNNNQNHRNEIRQEQREFRNYERILDALNDSNISMNNTIVVNNNRFEPTERVYSSYNRNVIEIPISKPVNELPKKKDGTLDMRHKVNRDYVESVSMKDDDLPRKKDGTLDMRYKVNQSTVMSASTFNDNNSMFSNSFFRGYKNESKPINVLNNTGYSGPLKSDGTPDMRYSVNKNASSVNYSYSNQSSYTGPLKKDGTPDMRYSVNKSNFSNSSYSYSNSNSSYSNYSTGSYSGGPLKKDGTPDMRYACNRRK
jgi:hypothetical protein